MTPTIDIVPTGLCNLASVRSAFERLGAEVRMASTADAVRDAALLVLPGVGAFGSAARSLRQSGLAAALVERVRSERPLLAICLGMQLLFEESAESPGESGLGVFPGSVRPLKDAPRSPLIGWNSLRPEAECELLEEEYAYFVHGYCVEETPPGCVGATSNYGQEYVAAFERGPLLACQFHPELSGSAGGALLQRWMTRGMQS